MDGSVGGYLCGAIVLRLQGRDLSPQRSRLHGSPISLALKPASEDRQESKDKEVCQKLWREQQQQQQQGTPDGSQRESASFLSKAIVVTTQCKTNH